mmetsp:Transcript_101945/g.161131  ORF Transcript_101945/g.161131 Transcript_101945/m.161131 type:complete len:245 (-) Transcript_101945:43-777(-)|eukprot:CAMPEP_0169210320 /NCGR_PEP_ID=MMETSP1016-20121227/15150_1 /TAXON_ID=342587 /ORGANISM="Karlodinium micrum, Strain CCMP2283" /LENGTH=244 /DNA_ID=CAMNT_0009287849 /DNA_START=87 /DNA_END=821 /DNA_ORIENTATION=-
MNDTAGRFSVKFIGNTAVEGHTVYMVKVTNPEGQTWNIQKRYRELRDLYDVLKETYGERLPQFPGKRIFGNSDPAFIAARQMQLQQFLDGVLKLERDIRTPVLRQFLGGPQQREEQNQERQYKMILDEMGSKLLNLALPPPVLDDTEVQQRLKTYAQAMKLHVLSQPVDPIHLRAPGFDGEPMPLCPSNSERFDALQKPPAAIGDAVVLSDMLSRIQQSLTPKEPIADAKKLIVPFPDIPLTSQ